jgi:TPR repeat protein
VRWFRAAAERKDPEGMNNLAVMLDQGLGTRADEAEAQRLFEVAARSGESAAAVNLALMLMRPPASDAAEALVRAYAWLNIAASLGHPDAQRYRANLQSKLTSEQISSAQQLSVKWAAEG